MLARRIPVETVMTTNINICHSFVTFHGASVARSPVGN